MYCLTFNLIFSYGLLGPSGCGKTTLLSCIVGRSELDSGDIMVKASKREEIGYMPQVRIRIHTFVIVYYNIL